MNYTLIIWMPDWKGIPSDALVKEFNTIEEIDSFQLNRINEGLTRKGAFCKVFDNRKCKEEV